MTGLSGLNGLIGAILEELAEDADPQPAPSAGCLLSLLKWCRRAPSLSPSGTVSLFHKVAPPLPRLGSKGSSSSSKRPPSEWCKFDGALKLSRSC